MMVHVLKSATQTGFLILSAAILSCLSPAIAMADDQIVRASCKKDLQMTESECDCVVTAVNNSLNEKQLAFFIASINQDQAGMIAAQSEISQDEMLELANFMTTTPTNCKGN